MLLFKWILHKFLKYIQVSALYVTFYPKFVIF